MSQYGFEELSLAIQELKSFVILQSRQRDGTVLIKFPSIRAKNRVMRSWRALPAQTKKVYSLAEDFSDKVNSRSGH